LGYSTSKCSAIRDVVSQPHPVLEDIGTLSIPESHSPWPLQQSRCKARILRARLSSIEFNRRMASTPHRHWSVVDLIDNIPVEPFAGFLVVLVAARKQR
jgi:hypothetical protein